MTPATNVSSPNNRDRSPKRVRLPDDNGSTRDSTKDNKAKSSTMRAPSKAADTALVSAVESLPDSVQPLILHYGRELIDVRTKLCNKQSIKQRMSDDANYVPRSVSATKFDLILPKIAQEENPERAEFLVAQVEQAKETYKATLKSVCEEACSLEITALETMEYNVTCKILHGLASAVNTLEGSDCNLNLKVVNLLVVAPNLFKYSPRESRSEMLGRYKQYHSIDDLPEKTAVVANDSYSNVEEQAHAVRLAATSMQRPENKGLKTLQNAAEAIFITPSRAYFAQKDANERTIAMKKLATDLIDGTVTEDAAMELDAEGGASFEHLQDLIQKESEKRDKKYKALERKCAALEKAVETKQESKNSNRRGNANNGASSNKKKSAPTGSNNNKPTPKAKNRSQSRTKNKSKEGKADDASNASNNGNKSNANKSPANSKKKKKQRSNNGRNRRSKA